MRNIAVFLTLLPITAYSGIVQKRPNVVLILVDDAGYADFGFAGSKDFTTPNIDTIAKEGVTFSDMHSTASVSGPSRCGLMTGRYQQLFGCETNASADLGLPLNERLISELLQLQGYATAAFGKWHMGSDFEEHPNSRGFDEFYGFLGGSRSYFFNKDHLCHPKIGIQHNREFVKFDGYLTDVLADKAVDFIDRNKEVPFFVYLSFNAVHSPFEAKQSDLELFKNHPRQILAAMTWSLDKAVGRVIEKLRKERIIDNTLLIFVSDNGGDFAKNIKKNNYPLKAQKGTEFEGGHRVVCAMRLESQIPQGKIFNGLSSTLDIYPTILALSGAKYYFQRKLDGVNLLPFLSNKIKRKINPHKWLFWRIERWKAVRYNNFKLISATGVGDRLYDMENDIGETKDLRKSHAKIYTLMKKKLYEWEDRLSIPLCQGEESWKKVKAHMYEEYFHNREPKYIYPNELPQ